MERHVVMKKHSTGPWSIDHIRNKSATKVRISSPQWASFASVVVRMKGEDSDTPQGIANARLVAAAPDLLDALWVCMEHNALHFGENHNTVIHARAAIDKATR